MVVLEKINGAAPGTLLYLQNAFLELRLRGGRVVVEQTQALVLENSLVKFVLFPH